MASQERLNVYLQLHVCMNLSHTRKRSLTIGIVMDNIIAVVAILSRVYYYYYEILRLCLYYQQPEERNIWLNTIQRSSYIQANKI